jgi:hypothetical protein
MAALLRFHVQLAGVNVHHTEIDPRSAGNIWEMAVDQSIQGWAKIA